MGRQLPQEAYARFDTYRLKKAKVMWVNFDWLASHGIDFPTEGLTSSFEERVLSAFAYMVPPSRGPPEAGDPDFDLNQHKDFYADRYGGSGMGTNQGSGRAGSAGKVQIKGIGTTPLVSTTQPFDHAHGGASLEEAIREAIWGEINHAELPQGSNRVIAVIDTGTYTEWIDGKRERRALIIREDPLRPAHLIANLSSPDDHARMATVDPLKLLPGPGGLARRFRQYVARLARVYGTAYGRRIFHGGFSPSNVEISGRFLDFGTETLQPGHGSIRILENTPSSTWPDEQYYPLAQELWLSLRDRLSMNGADDGPPNSDIWRAAYEKAAMKELILASGFPPQLLDTQKRSLEYKKLQDAISAFKSVYDNNVQNVDLTMVPEPTNYHLPRIYMMLSELENPDSASLSAALESQMPHHVIREAFVVAYLGLRSKLLTEASNEGVTHTAFSRLVRTRAKRINEPTPDLYRPQMRSDDVRLISEYMNSGDRSRIWNHIDDRVKQGRRSAHAHQLQAYQVLISETPEFLQKRYRVRVYDAKTDSEQELVIPVHEDCDATLLP